jgi:uncharacterized protein YkwD
MTNSGRYGVLIGVVAAAVLGVAIPAATASAAPAAGQAVSALVAQTNDARRAAGCGPVEVDENLRSVAQQHAADMARMGYLEHSNREGESTGDRVEGATSYDSYAENLAHGYPTAAEVLAVWMGSPGHRENIENCDYTAIGVGYVADGHYWVQDFAG